MALHSESTDVHKAAYVQDADPGAIGAGKLWLDTSGGTGTWTIKSRNAADSGWETVNAGSVSAGIITAALLLQSVISPTSLGASANNYSPTSMSTSSWLRLTSSLDVDITGLATGASGRTVAIVNIGSFNITLKNASGSSTATNRFAFAGDIVLTPNTGVILIYDNTTQRWRALLLPANAPINAQYVTLSADATLTSEAVLGSAVIMYGVFASRPASTIAGLLYYSTDTDTFYRDNGVSWDAITLDWAQVTGKPTTFAPTVHEHTAAGAGGALTADEHISFSEFTEISTPSTPAPNKIRVYGKDVAGVTALHYVGQDGIEIGPLAGAGSTSSHNHTSTGGDGGVLTDDQHDGFSEYTEIATPTPPAGNKVRVFGKDVGGNTQPYAIGEDTIALPMASVRTSINAVISGGGSVITVGIQFDVEVDFDCEIEQVTLLADQSGSIIIDIWKDNYASYPPTVGDTITASAKPTISGATKSQDATLTGWTKTITAGQILRINVDSVTTITRCTLAIKVRRT